MPFSCSKCQFEYDQADAFCRKCGASLPQEGTFVELPAQAQAPAEARPVPEPEIVQINVTALATLPSQPDLTLAPPSKVGALSRKVGTKVSQALKSENGKRLAKGATALALAVGMELLTKAGKSEKPANRSVSRPPTSLADAALKAFEERLAEPSGYQVEETWTREVYIRRSRPLR